MSDLSYTVELTAPDIEPYRAGNTSVDYVTTFEATQPGPHVVVTALTHGNEPVLFENSADLRARKNPELTQPVPRPEL